MNSVTLHALLVQILYDVCPLAQGQFKHLQYYVHRGGYGERGLLLNVIRRQVGSQAHSCGPVSLA